MTTTRVGAGQRFSAHLPCPICGGFASQRRGKGRRCHGYLSHDGSFAHCTREEYAAGLTSGPSGTYAHVLAGDCKCGGRHGAQPRALHSWRGQSPRRPVRGNRPCVAPYPCEYRDERNELQFRVARYVSPNGGKRYAIFHPDSEGKWHAGRGEGTRPIYRLPDIRAAIASDAVIHVVEGEKKVHLLLALGLQATCNDCGAGHWTGEHSHSLRSAPQVVIWEDNDDVGRRHAQDVARSLRAAGVEDIRVVGLPGTTEGQGIDDWLDHRRAEGANDSQLLSELDEMVHSASVWAEVAGESGEPRSRAIITRLSMIQARPLEWLWQGYVPLGMLTLLDGDPGLGKSTVLLDLAALLSVGSPMPDGSPGLRPSGTVLMTHEDDLACVVRPRLEAAGADLERIAVVRVRTSDGEREPRIDGADLQGVAEAAKQVEARLIIFDPLMPYLPKQVDANRDQDVRSALALLRDLAERTGVAVVAVRHLNKSIGGTPLYRGGGSIGIIGAARIALLMAADPSAPDETRVLAVMKSNLAKKPPALRLRIGDLPGGAASRVEWLGACEYTASALLAPPMEPQMRSALDTAKDFLRDALKDGPRGSEEVTAEALEMEISKATLRRARAQLGVVGIKTGQPGRDGQGWLIALPEPKGSKVTEANANVFNTTADDPLRPSHAAVEVCLSLGLEGVPPPDTTDKPEAEAGSSPVLDHEHLRQAPTGNSLMLHGIAEGAHSECLADLRHQARAEAERAHG